MIDEKKCCELKKTALEVRKDVVRMVGFARSHGLASALTVTDMLVYMYWAYMNASFEDRNRADRDRLVLSKGSAVATQYACLARRGFFKREELWSYRRLGAMLQGYPDIRTPGVDAPGGVYGGGLGIAAGFCMSLKMRTNPFRVFCLMADGEFHEGVVWESIYTAASKRMGRLVLVIDSNSNVETAPMEDITGPKSLSTKLQMFGWTVQEADGHDFYSLDEAFDSLDYDDPRPKAICARTRTGSGISFLQQGGRESSPMSSDEIDRALAILESESPHLNGREV